MIDRDQLDSFVDLDTAAQRMQRSTSEVMDLVERRVLRGVDLGWGLILVEPAILSGSIHSR